LSDGIGRRPRSPASPAATEPILLHCRRSRTVRDRREPFARRHARAALRFNVGVAVYLALIVLGLRLAPGSPYTIQLVPFLFFLNLLIAFNWLVFTGIALQRAGTGRRWTYPLVPGRPD
jgi:uncharacterized Tic20 family protein